mgnify:CR=1 FL=1
MAANFTEFCVFAEEPLDRASDSRVDRQWIADRLADPSSVFLPLYRGDPLVRDGRAVMLAQAARAEFPEPSAIIFLGLKGGQAHFAVDFSSARTAEAAPFADLPQVLALAAHPNVMIKISGACTLSRETYPFADIWDPLARVFDAWGFERCLWGTDWTRAFAVVNYEQAVAPFLETDRLSAANGTSSSAPSTSVG